MQFLYVAVILVPLLLAALISFNNPKRRSTKIARAFYLTVIFIFTYVPIVVLIIFSFNSARSTGVWEGFSLKWYKALFEDSQLIFHLVTQAKHSQLDIVTLMREHFHVSEVAI